MTRTRIAPPRGAGVQPLSLHSSTTRHRAADHRLFSSICPALSGWAEGRPMNHPVIIPVSSVRGKGCRGKQGDGDTTQTPSDTSVLTRDPPQSPGTSDSSGKVLGGIRPPRTQHALCEERASAHFSSVSGSHLSASTRTSKISSCHMHFAPFLALPQLRLVVRGPFSVPTGAAIFRESSQTRSQPHATTRLLTGSSCHVRHQTQTGLPSYRDVASAGSPGSDVPLARLGWLGSTAKACASRQFVQTLCPINISRL